MRFPRKRGSTSVMISIFIPDNSVTTGAGVTGLTNASANLTIEYRRELDAAVTSYSGANIEAQTTIGTYQAPSSSSKIRFKETPISGTYELQFHDSAPAFGAGDVSQSIQINIREATTTALKIGPNGVLIPLVPWDYQDGVRMGLTALPNQPAGANGGLPLGDASGRVDVIKVAGTTQTASDLGATLATVAGYIDTEIGTLLARLGAFTGSGVNTVLGMFKALLSRTASTPSDVGGTFDPATDSVEALRDRGDAAWADSGTPPSAAAIATQVRTELGVELGRIDVGIGTRATQVSVDDLPTNAELAASQAAADDATLAAIGTGGAALTSVPWNPAWDTEVQSEVQDAIEVNHLDHLLAVTYDPASKPGVVDALLNELVESDAGVARYTANALEQAPGGSAPTVAAIADAVLEELIADHSGVAGSLAAAIHPDGIRKNQAFDYFDFQMVSGGTGVPGLTVTAQRRIDGSAFSACANAVTEIAYGWYTINLAASDLNGDRISLRFSALGADDRDITFKTSP